MKKTIIYFSGKAHELKKELISLKYDEHFCAKCLKSEKIINMMFTGDKVKPLICKKCFIKK